ncbi:CGNR zinc finger domain-containing protein, partial [Streptomyces sp. SID5614]|nr:CGNR zinc finger domain-containing protein [Streptomyces sp. SID5614]
MPSTADDWSSRHSVLTNARRAAALVNALTVDRPDPDEVTKILYAYGESGTIDLT